MRGRDLVLSASATVACALATFVGGSSAFGQEAQTPVTTGPTHVSGQPVLEEVVVTAQRRSENLQKVPLAVTSLSPEVLQRTNANNLTDVASMVPSLQMSSFAGMTSQMQISLRAQRQPDPRITNDPSAVIYLSEVPVGRPYGTAVSGFLDVASVQVLNGPQGTLFGRNTTGGAVLIVPQAPTPKFEAQVMAGGGSHNLVEGTAIMNAPISDRVWFRIAVTGADRDGLIKNYGLGPDEDSLHHIASRASLKIETESNLSSTFIVDYFGNRSSGGGGVLKDLRPTGAPALSPVNGPILRAQLAARASGAEPFYSVDTNIPTYDRGHEVGITNITEYPWSSSFSIKNIAGYRMTHNVQNQDLDGTEVTLLHNNYTNYSRQFSEEPQISYKSNLVDVVSGAFFFDEKGYFITQGSAYLASGAHNSSASIYTQATWHVAPKLTLTTGGRWTWDRRKIDAHSRTVATPSTCLEVDQTGTPLNPCSVVRTANFNSPTWNVSLDYALSDEQKIYLAHRHGYRAGGFTATPFRPAQFAPFRPETVNDVELGYKGEYSLGGDAALRLNVAAYNTWSRNLQRPLAILDGSLFVLVTANAAAAQTRGLEFQSTLVPMRDLSISFSYTYTHAKYTSFAGLAVPINTVKFAEVPTHKGAISVRYQLPTPERLGDISVEGTVSYQTSTQLDQLPATFATQPAYTLVDANLTWDRFLRDNLSLSIWAKNIANTHYFTVATAQYDGALGYNLGYFGEPRTYGLRLTAKF